MTSKRRNKNKKKSGSPTVASQATLNMADSTENPPLPENSETLQMPPFFTSTPTPTASNNGSITNESLHDSENDTSFKQVDMDIINCKIEMATGETGEASHPSTNEVSGLDIDNNSLLNALQAHNDAKFTALNSSLSATINGAISQLKIELKAEFKQALDKNRKDFLVLKRNTADQISKIELKVTSNVGELNTRLNTVNDKVAKINDVITKSNLQKVDGILAKNTEKSNELSSQFSDLEKKVANCERVENEILESIAFMNGQLEEAKSKIAERDQAITWLKTRCETNNICQARLATRIESLESKSISSDTRQRKVNLIFEGLAETPNENTKGVIINIFNNSGGLANPTDIDIAYRLGKPAENHSRPILVAFHTQHAKDLVLRNAVKIKTSSNLPNLWINRDQPDLTRKQIANTRRCYNLMKANNHRCQLQGTSITYEGKVYHYKDLNNLPVGSRLEDTRMITCNNGTEICFQGELAYLSNFYRSPFIYKEKPFVSAEQAFQWMKALSANQLDTAKKILSLEDPLTIKQIGNDIPSSDNWALSEVKTLRAIAFAKFSQNRTIGERLRTSVFDKFHECTRNLYWGTGQSLPLSTREIDSAKFEGTNIFGQILLDVRTKLRNDANRISSSPKPAHDAGKSPPNKPSKSPGKASSSS